MSDTPNDRQAGHMHYELTLRTTGQGIGFFSTRPVEQLPLPEAARYLVAHPHDDFMRKFLLEGVEVLEPHELGGLIGENLHAPRPFLAMLYEACILYPKYRGLAGRFQGVDPADLAPESSHVAIRAELLPDHFTHVAWIEAFEANRSRHEPLPTMEEVDEEPPVAQTDLDSLAGRSWVRVEDVLAKADARAAAMPSSPPRPPAAETYARAIERLAPLEVFAEPELRHQSSLSPIALMRRWRLDRTVRNGRNDYRVTGLQTSWGKGLSLDAARASYAMELVERVSSFASVSPEGLLGYVKPYPLVQATHAELIRDGRNALDPNAVRLDVPYQGQPLWWVEAETWRGEPLLVPVQFVFLFCNLDEPGFFGGLGSTGLASGNTPTEARFSALLECIERDAEGVALYRPEECFTLASDDPDLGPLLTAYADKGVHPVFQDVSTEFGVPCLRAFVVGEDGSVAKGTAAHLDGRKAAVSALTEVAYPYPEGPASKPAPQGLPVRRYEDLPNFSSGDYGRDLARLEEVLAANGYEPIYLDLTRQDVGLPVFKAMVPGLELTADLERFSRVSPRLWARYVSATK